MSTVMLCLTRSSDLMLTVQQTRGKVFWILFILLLIVVIDVSLIRRIRLLASFSNLKCQLCFSLIWEASQALQVSLSDTDIYIL